MKTKALLTSIFFVFLDQIVKYICLENLKPIGSIQIIRDFFYLTYVENKGAAFGVFQGARYIFIPLTLVVLTLCFKYYKSIKDGKYENIIKISIILISSGAIGNLIDRVFRGYVIDMFHFIFWGKEFAVFNIADIFVVTGTFIFALAIIFKDLKAGSRTKKEVV